MAKVVAALSCAVAAAMIPQSASAQNIYHSGQISSVFLSSGYNEAFRVTLIQNGANPLAECVGGFAYVNISWDNYQAYVAELTTLYVRGTTISLTMTKDSNGFCQLIEFGT